MNDLNFFEPYIEKRRFKLESIHILYVVFILSIVTISTIGIFNQLRIDSLRNDIIKRIEVAENPETVTRVDEIKSFQIEVDNFKDELSKIIELDKSIDSRATIGDELLKEIKSKMPIDLFLSNFSAYDRHIQISGISKDTYSIAELSKGLEMIERVERAFVSNITNTDEYYNFSLNLTLKDVNADGNLFKENQIVEENQN